MPEVTPTPAEPVTPEQPTPVIVPLAQPIPASPLPEAVQAIRRIEQKNNPAAKLSASGNTPPPPNKPGTRTHLFNFIPWTGRVGMVFKILFAGLAAVIALLLVMAVLMLTSIDTAIFKLGLNGVVIDNANQPVDGAILTIDGQNATTADGGKFSFNGLTIGTYTVHIVANGYETSDVQVGLTRSFLNYSNYRQFTLKKSGVANLSGKLIAPKPDYKFTNDRIVIAGKEYRINDDGTYLISNLVTGMTKFEFRSVNFKDEVREFQLDSGDKALPDITLVPAGDIVATDKSYIREDVVQNLKVTVESVDDQFITIAEDGSLRVRDLEIGKEYKLRTEYPGYETRDYTITVAQGENQLFDFKVVEKGFVPFQRKVGNYLELFVSNFDGKNESALTTGDIQAYGEYIEGNNLYFMSTRDNLFSGFGSAVMLAYVIPVTGGNPQRITTNTTDLGRIVPNLKAGKLANIRKGETNESRVLEITNLQGTNRNIIHSIASGKIDDVAVSNDGTTMWYTIQSSTAGVSGMYHAATDSTAQKGDFIMNKENMIIFAVSNSGDRVLYSTTNDATNLQDLYTYTFSTKQDSLVKSSYTGSQYQFLSGTDDKIVFMDSRSGASNLYLLDLGTNTDHMLSAFTDDTEGVEAVFQQAGYVLYRSQKGLYVIDPLQPHAGKLITNNVARYTGYDF